jgi:hypothetical protein
MTTDARDKAGNRRLHVDQSCTLILLYLFNPVVVSLRSLQPASEEELLDQSAKRPPQPPDSRRVAARARHQAAA